MSRNHEATDKVKEKFEEAAERFQPDKGNDKELLDQCNKHLSAFSKQRALTETMKAKFFDKVRGEWDLKGKLKDILDFETRVAEFVQLFPGRRDARDARSDRRLFLRNSL